MEDYIPKKAKLLLYNIYMSYLVKQLLHIIGVWIGITIMLILIIFMLTTANDKLIKSKLTRSILIGIIIIICLIGLILHVRSEIKESKTSYGKRNELYYQINKLSEQMNKKENYSQTTKLNALKAKQNELIEKVKSMYP